MEINRILKNSRVLKKNLKNKVLNSPVKYCSLKSSIKTRWGSFLEALDTIVSQKEIVIEIIDEEVICRNEYGLFLIDEVDLIFCEAVINFLKLFDDSTKILEAKCSPTLSQSIPVYTGLYNHSERFLAGIEDNRIKELLNVPILNSQNKLTEMFNKVVLLSFCGMILDPRIKTSIYLKNSWNSDLEYMLNQ